MNEERLFHLDIPRSVRAEYALLPGDPGRVPSVAALLPEAEPLAEKREFRSYLGRIAGKSVIVCSTGIGGPSAAIAMEELALLGVRTFIRLGTCGGMQLPVESGHYVIPTAAVRAEGTSLHYAPLEFPAAADFDVVAALGEAAAEAGVRTHTGVVHCKDSFYGQHAPEKSPVSARLLEKWDACKRLGVLASEMETAALFTAAHALGVRCGCILLCIWNQERAVTGLSNPTVEDTSLLVRLSVRATEKLIESE